MADPSYTAAKPGQFFYPRGGTWYVKIPRPRRKKSHIAKARLVVAMEYSIDHPQVRMRDWDPSLSGAAQRIRAKMAASVISCAPRVARQHSLTSHPVDLVADKHPCGLARWRQHSGVAVTRIRV